ncbi:MAG: ABC transporter permease subunit/CPBP intramembrane protease [Planctomycetota bacterium]
MRPRLSPMRIGRLCLKELRESLRDRRTIVTLVLMPLLVYPLLSLVLNRVLLTSVTSKAQNGVSIGIASEFSDSQLPGILRLGYVLLQERSFAPTFIEEEIKDGEIRTLENKTALPQPVLVPLSGQGREALRNGVVDLVITGQMPAIRTSAQQEKGVESYERFGFFEPLKEVEFDPVAAKELIGRLEVKFRKSDGRSERALQLLERILAAVNNEASRGVIGVDYEAPFRVSATPVVMQGNYADLLATMVPLVLVLMTMAGAVYPAIDLTAGERERGTMEALIVSPVPSYALLLAKYSAVVTVALLTALANLAAMSITLWASGIGKLVFGEGVISTGVIGTVLILLVLFTMFFAALLLAITSFAKSFKEAQAYLIPLMLLALTPGVMSLLPGIQFTSLLATVPLVNIVLLAREVLNGSAEWNTALVAVICNGVYALAALAVASRLFGSDAAIQGSREGWKDLFSLPREPQIFPRVDQMALTMAVMFPLYFVLSSALPNLREDLGERLALSALVSFLLLLGLPGFVCLVRKIELKPTFLIQPGNLARWSRWGPGILLIAGAAWMVAHELVMAGQMIGIKIDMQQIERVSEFKDQLQALPLWLVLFAFALTPAVCEEFLFRGFILNSLRKYSLVWAVILSSLMFGLMHVLTSNVLAVERLMPTTFMGLILGFVAVRTRSILPGIILHFLHNSLLLSLNHFSEELKAMQILVEENEHLPVEWLATGGLALVVGFVLIWRTPKQLDAEEATTDSLASA